MPPSMTRYSFAALPLLLLLLGTMMMGRTRAMEVAAAPEDVGLASWRLQEITHELERLVSRSKIPGAAFIVTRGGKYVYHGEAGYSDMETLTGFRTNTINRLLSMSKPVSAVAVMKLVDEKKLSLNDTVAKYLPEWGHMEVFVEQLPNGALRTEPAKRQITILELLTHTSGLSYGYGFGDMTAVDNLYPSQWRVPMMTLPEFSETISKVPLLHQPGTTWRYSYGYDLLGVLLAKVTGQSPDLWMKQNIFDPLKMVDTGFAVPMDKINRYATSYTATPLGRLQFVFRPRVDFVSYSPPTFKSLGGGLVSTAKDFARLAQMLLNGGRLDGVQVLSPRAVDLMWRNYLPKSMSPMKLNGWESEDNTGQALGFTLGVDRNIFSVTNWEEFAGDNRIGAVGWGGGAQTNFNINADTDTVITYMTQKIGGGDDYFQSVVVKGVMEAIFGPSPRKANGGIHTYAGWPTPQEEQFGHNAPLSMMERYWG